MIEYVTTYGHTIASAILGVMILAIAWRVIRLEHQLKNHIGKGGLK